MVYKRRPATPLSNALGFVPLEDRPAADTPSTLPGTPASLAAGTSALPAAGTSPSLHKGPEAAAASVAMRAQKVEDSQAEAKEADAMTERIRALAESRKKPRRKKKGRAAALKRPAAAPAALKRPAAAPKKDLKEDKKDKKKVACKLPFPGLPKKNPGSQQWEDYVIFTDIAQKKWRVQRRGDPTRYDKGFPFNQGKEAWARLCEYVA